MDLDEDVDDAVTVWVSRVDTVDETIVTAWAYRDKAEAWVAHELGADKDAITWRETRGTEPGITVAGHYEGDIVASITQVEVMDPRSLARQYPTDMPSAQHVLDREGR
jgi:predicted phage tail protein